MWIDLTDAGVLGCNLVGAWMNKALTVALRGQRRHDRGSDWSSVCSCSPFLSLSLSARLKLGPEMV